MSRKPNVPFEIGQWSDFVRGLVDPETEREMRQVLDESAEARSQVAALELTAELAAAERTTAPPSWAVRCAKALGSLRRQEQPEWSSPGHSLWRKVAMSLTFDSLTNPVLAGTRDARGEERQMVFEQGDYRVDLRLEPEFTVQQAVLVGQLMRTQDDEVAPVAEVPVFAVQRDSETADGQRVVATAQTSSFGEFQAEGLPVGALDLLLVLDENHCFVLNLTAAGGEELGGVS